MTKTTAKIVEQATLKSSVLTVVKVEEVSVIVIVDGWRMRIYFEDGVDRTLFSTGKQIEVKYTGDIDDVHSLKFEKLK